MWRYPKIEFWHFLTDLKAEIFQVPLDTEFEGTTSLTPLHVSALDVIDSVKDAALKENCNIVSEVFEIIFKISRVSLTVKPNSKEGRFCEKFSLLGETCLETMVKFYCECCRADNILV